jgi:asparagine synthase (glutamine-hydrolysing)
MIFEGQVYPPNYVILSKETFTHKMWKDYREACENLIKRTEGNFAFVVAEPERLITGRDSMGVQPLYYGEDDESAILASERKIAWKIGILNPHSFPPGHIATVDKHGFAFKPVKTIGPSEPKKMTMHQAAQKLHTLLHQSIKQRVAGLKNVGIAFSGGLDSSIIAFLAKKSKVAIDLIHVSLKNQPETEHARTVAEQLGLPLHIRLFKEEDVEKVTPKVLELVEEADPIKTSIGIAFNWVAQEAAKMELNVLLAGQGADEFFGGYKRYVDIYLAHGSKAVRREMFNDIIHLHETNLERDHKICSSHNVELRLPFATYPIARFAIDLPMKLKIERRQDTKRKLILRKMAKNLGLPKTVVEKPKKAVQYATGIDKVLKMMAKNEGLTVKEMLQDMFQSIQKKMIQDE